jgi:hypothetical protein
LGVPCFSLASPRTFLSLLTGIPTEDSSTGSHIRSHRARVLYVSRREAVRQCDRVLLHLYGSLPSPQNAALIGPICTGRGQRGRLRLLLRNSTTYEEVRLPLFPSELPTDVCSQWKERALALDDYLHYSDWKRSPQNAYYDSALIKRVLRSLQSLRNSNDIEGVRAVLEVALRSNFAGVESYRLYSETFFGTKDLVEEYVEEVARSIEFIRDAPVEVISLEEKSRFLRYGAKRLGSTALCLSGGAGFAYCQSHVSLVLSIWTEEQGLRSLWSREGAVGCGFAAEGHHWDFGRCHQYVSLPSLFRLITDLYE